MSTPPLSLEVPRLRWKKKQRMNERASCSNEPFGSWLTHTLVPSSCSHLPPTHSPVQFPRLRRFTTRLTDNSSWCWKMTVSFSGWTRLAAITNTNGIQRRVELRPWAAVNVWKRKCMTCREVEQQTIRLTFGPLDFCQLDWYWQIGLLFLLLSGDCMARAIRLGLGLAL